MFIFSLFFCRVSASCRDRAWSGNSLNFRLVFILFRCSPFLPPSVSLTLSHSVLASFSSRYFLFTASRFVTSLLQHFLFITSHHSLVSGAAFTLVLVCLFRVPYHDLLLPICWQFCADDWASPQLTQLVASPPPSPIVTPTHCRLFVFVFAPDASVSAICHKFEMFLQGQQFIRVAHFTTISSHNIPHRCSCT